MMQLIFGAASDRGRVREINEDAFGSRPDAGLFVVCDGMGGGAAGEVASRIATDTVLEQVGATDRDDDESDDHEFLPKTGLLAVAVRRANHAILRRAKAEAGHAGMGTTIVAVSLAEHVASVAHVGDSRAYLWHNGCFEALTNDHSLVEHQVRAGLLDRASSLQSAQQNVLLRALGRDLNVEVELGEVPVRPGDFLLLCTDGLTRMVTEAAMAETITVLRDPQQICDRLVATANDNGGLDNVTAVVVGVRS